MKSRNPETLSVSDMGAKIESGLAGIREDVADLSVGIEPLVLRVTMFFSFLADVVQASHLFFLVFTLIGQILILTGLALRWQWVRNPWFRTIHLVCIVFVAMEYIVGMECPLTDLEVYLRGLAGEKSSDDWSFVGWLLNEVVFPFGGVDTSHWGFLVGYVSFALIVLATFLLAPPRWKRKPEQSATQPEPIPASRGEAPVAESFPG
jgi:uncharacterized protein DUF2784